MSLLRVVGAPWALLARTITAVRHAGLSPRACLVQVHELGNRSVWLVGSGLAFFGAVMVSIANVQARRYAGSLVVVGPSYFALLVREFGPILSGLLCAARSGAATAAELSWMEVGEQVEALRMSAGDPLADLVAPRVVGGLIALPLLCALGTAAACASAVATTYLAYGADGSAFMDARYVTSADLLCAFVKSVLFGLFIPLVGARHGLASEGGGASAVGRATTRGVVESCFGCLALDFLVGQLFLLA